MASVDASISSKLDPVLQNTLRYTISAKEYKTLHEYLITRSPCAIRRRAPPPPKYAALFKDKDESNAATVRASLRIFLATQVGLKIWDLITTYILQRGKPRKYIRLVYLSWYSVSKARIGVTQKSPYLDHRIFGSPFLSP